MVHPLWKLNRIGGFKSTCGCCTIGAHLVHLCPAVLVAAAQRGAVPEQQEAAGQLAPLQHAMVQRGEWLAVFIIHTGSQVQQGLGKNRENNERKSIKRKCYATPFVFRSVYRSITWVKAIGQCKPFPISSLCIPVKIDYINKLNRWNIHSSQTDSYNYVGFQHPYKQSYTKYGDRAS